MVYANTREDAAIPRTYLEFQKLFLSSFTNHLSTWSERNQIREFQAGEMAEKAGTRALHVQPRFYLLVPQEPFIQYGPKQNMAKFQTGQFLLSCWVQQISISRKPFIHT